MTPEELMNLIFKPEGERPPMANWMPEPGAVAPPLTCADLEAAIEAVKNAPFKEDPPILIPPTPANKRMLKYRSN